MTSPIEGEWGERGTCAFCTEAKPWYVEFTDKDGADLMACRECVADILCEAFN